MEHKRAWLLYVVVRVLAFTVPFVAVVVALPSWPYAWVVGALAGTVIGLCVSYIFLKPQRDRIAEDIAEMRGRRDTRSDDDRDEDRTLDGAGTADDDRTDDEPVADEGETATRDDLDAPIDESLTDDGDAAGPTPSDERTPDTGAGR